MIFSGEEEMSGEPVRRVPGEYARYYTGGHADRAEERGKGPVLGALFCLGVVFLVAERDSY